MLVMQSYIWNCNPKFKNLAAGRTLQKTNKNQKQTLKQKKNNTNKTSTIKLYQKTLPTLLKIWGG